MNNIVYRVVLRVGYCEAYFDFSTADEACIFARISLEHMVENEDTKKQHYINLQIINMDAKESEEE